MTQPRPAAGWLGSARRSARPAAQLLFGAPGQLHQRAERALDHVRRVVRLAGEFLALPPDGALALVDFAEAGLAQPTRQPGAGIAPARCRHS